MSTNVLPAAASAEHLTRILRQEDEFRTVQVRTVAIVKETVKQRSRTSACASTTTGRARTHPRP